MMATRAGTTAACGKGTDARGGRRATQLVPGRAGGTGCARVDTGRHVGSAAPAATARIGRRGVSAVRGGGVGRFGHWPSSRRHLSR